MILLRSAAFNLFFFGTTAVLTIVAVAARANSPASVLRYARLWARTIIWGLRMICRIRVDVTGIENLPSGPVIVASAHQSAFDTLVWLTLVPRCCYVLKQELLSIPLFGGLIRKSGMIAIDRAKGAGAVRALLRGAARAKAEGCQIIIFPEGTRVSGQNAHPLQGGVAAIASRTGLPVVPVATDSGRYWGRRAFQKRPGTIRVVIRPALSSTLPRDEMMRALAEAIRLSGRSGAEPMPGPGGAI